MLSRMLCLTWLGLQLAAYGASAAYTENLDIVPLTPSHLLASFSFRSNVSRASYEQQHFDLFPRSLGQILQHSQVQELHLRFSSGRWNELQWGARPARGWHEGGTGVEIWAWIEAKSMQRGLKASLFLIAYDAKYSSFERWITLNNALSGLFCASMNFIDATRTTRPLAIFQHQRPHRDSYLLHGALPHEVVCTENLTPFLKLLPCKGHAGIASLLDGHKLFDADWQTMAIDVQTLFDNRGQRIISIDQSVEMVLNVERSKRHRDNPIPRPAEPRDLACDESKPYFPASCYPSTSRSDQSWTVGEIFGHKIRGSCISESPHSVCIHVPSDRKIDNPARAAELIFGSPSRRCYQPPNNESLELVLSHLGPQTYNNHSEAVLTAERSIFGHGQERGSVKTILTNTLAHQKLDVVYFEALPWFMKPYLHTLHISPGDLLHETHYRPGMDRIRGTQMELKLSIPAATSVTISYAFDKAILRYTEYPPDANRGFDVAPAVVQIQRDDEPALVYVRSTSLLLPLPTPDFSMPYNVIILTSTVMALAFGSIFNLLVRRFVAADEVGLGTLAKAKRFLKQTIQRYVRKADLIKKTQ